jgi:hypothetical protein
VEEFVAHYSRSRILGLIALTIVMALTGLWLVGGFGSPPLSNRTFALFATVVGWLNIAYASLSGLGWIKKLFDRRPPLQIGPAGVLWRPCYDYLIPWSDIMEVKTWRFQRQSWIVVRLRDPDRLRRRGFTAFHAFLNRQLANGDMLISLSATDRSFNDAMAAVARFRLS